MDWISLPCYEGFDAIAIWPCRDTVISCYGLLSTSMISTPVATGMKIQVPLYYGVRYAAFHARNSDETGTVTMYNERPSMLCYHESCFHVMDVPGCKCLDIHFGTVDKIISERYHGEHCHGDPKTKFHTADMIDMIKFKPFFGEIEHQPNVLVGENKTNPIKVDAGMKKSLDEKKIKGQSNPVFLNINSKYQKKKELDEKMKNTRKMTSQRNLEQKMKNTKQLDRKMKKKGNKDGVKSIRNNNFTGLREKSCKDGEIKLFNRFSVLKEERELYLANADIGICSTMFIIANRNIFSKEKQKKVHRKIKQNQNNLEPVKPTRNKCGKDHLKQFETENPFHILKGHQENDVARIIEVHKLLMIPKLSLRKCKRCNFKKRTCAMEPSSCKALEYLCHKCKKIGHAPGSLFCKAKSKCTKVEAKVKRCHINSAYSKQWRADVFLLVMKRITHLEAIDQIKERRNREIMAENQRMEKKFSDNIMILMYIFINHDLFSPTRNKNKKSLTKEKILKEAKYCAKKFLNQNEPGKLRKFVQYCAKIANKMLPKTKNNLDSIIKKVGLFQRMYVKNEPGPVHINQDKAYDDETKHDNQVFHNAQSDSMMKVRLYGGGFHDKSSEKQDASRDCKTKNQNELLEGESVQSKLVDIPQLDGFDDEDKISKGKSVKQIYGIKCNIRAIVQLVNFLRSFNFLWISSSSHWLCTLSQSCFFCYIRSSCLRLRKERFKGPKMLQLNEFVNQLDQYVSFLGWDCLENSTDLPSFIDNTLRLIHRRENFCSVFHLGDDHCEECKKENDFAIIKIKTEKQNSDDEGLEIREIIQKALQERNQNKECIHKLILDANIEETCLILHLSKPVSINISDGSSYHGMRVSYRSHVEKNQNNLDQAFFRNNNQMYTQREDGSINQSFFGTHKNVSLISLFLTNEKGLKVLENVEVDEFIYGDEAQLKLRKQYKKFILPQEFQEQQEFLKRQDRLRNLTPKRKAEQEVRDQNPERKEKKGQYDKIRDNLPERKDKKAQHDKVRDTLPERKDKKAQHDKIRDALPERKEKKAQHDKIRDALPERNNKRAQHDKIRDALPERKDKKAHYDKVRDKLPERKAKKARHDKIRDKTVKRKDMHKEIESRDYRKAQRNNYEATETRRIRNNIRNRKRYEKLISLTLLTDTGFDVVCSSCLQYKNKDFCKSIEKLSKEQSRRFIIKFCFILKNRTKGQFICNSCFNDIKRNKTPKKSHINQFKFANYPRSFILQLKKKCNFKECETSRKMKEDRENYERRALKLNKLEAYLLKLVIPFVRIAHCPRGPYLKVRGDLILISSDIDHSLSRILPSEQSLIPVSFKRKLAYTGSYLEEYVEKEKVKMYFAWLKEHNHLFKDIELNTHLVEEFFKDSIEATKDFECNTREVISHLNDDEEKQVNEDVSESVFKDDHFVDHEYQDPQEVDWTHNQTTMFLNKYCENTNIPSVANKMADIIVDYESSQGISIENEDDFEIDDEIITEDEFFRNIDQKLDRDDEHCQSDMEFSSAENETENEELLQVDTDQRRNSSNLDLLLNPSEEESKMLSNKAKAQAKDILTKVEKMCVAPGESGLFQNWGDDIFLEEKCFPNLFPYGTEGYLSSCIDESENRIGFAAYCVNQILSADPKFREDTSYLFFILLVKELIQLKRCKTTYFRQVTKLPNLTKNDICTTDRENLSRYNRSFEVFKNVRGTSMYYEQSKKNLMALLRQNGCPSVFLTLSCAEFDWPELLKEIAETVYRRKFTVEEINNLSDKERKRLISDNVVQSTMHFQKRVEKLFQLMGYDFFDGKCGAYHVSSYFFRVEFQQRGAPHIHSLLWLKDGKEKDAPNFWFNPEDLTDTEDENKKVHNDERIKKIEMFAEQLITTSPEDMCCEEHDSVPYNNSDTLQCDKCRSLREKVDKYQKHMHTFTCAKKKKTMTIRDTEGHGRLTGSIKGAELLNIPICRFHFPQFPLDETRLILGLSKEDDKGLIKTKKQDLNKIVKFLIRQTHSSNDGGWEKLKKMNFWEFLHAVGMFHQDKQISEYTDDEKKVAKQRYLNALSASVQGSAKVFMKRKVKDIFVNGYNKKIMRIFKSNHDLQICIDQYSCAQYICGYLTKNESGMSILLKAVNDETTNLSQIGRLNALAAVLDKHREVSIQEAIYRLLGLSMTKSSVIVKYLSTVHPHLRDGLLKGNMEELDEGDSIFHNSPHQYYENRPEESIDQEKIDYDKEELEDNYWNDLSLAEFRAKYDIVYGKIPKPKRNGKTSIIPLKNNKGYIRRRSAMAVLRYYLNYNNDEDLARGLLILFLPFRDEMSDIHTKDVKNLLDMHKDVIEGKRGLFEKYKLMSDLITTINNIDGANNQYENDDIGEEENENMEIETTSEKDIDEFNKWAKGQASRDISKFKTFMNVVEISALRSNIASLNHQQRRLFDDFTERCISTDEDEPPVYLFIGGNAGTGKSFLVKLLIEAVKLIKIKSGDELQKPPVIVMAPTANASFIIGGKTIDSVLGFLPKDGNQYITASAGRMAMMKFQFENVSVIFCDEISMVGATKLLKINFRLQHLVDENFSQVYMGGISFVASGDLWQLPPIQDQMVTEKSPLDGRPELSPSHWKQNFRIFYLTEKMRSQKDPVFSDICDRIARGTTTPSDEEYLASRVQSTPSEESNENFKTGKLSIIVTTNPKRDLINHQKLEKLLPHTREYICHSIDRVTNVPVKSNLPDNLKNNSGSLQSILKVKVGAPIVITKNHDKQKYREDGIMNGARGFVQAVQTSKENPEKVDVIWIIFNNESVGRLYRFEHNHLRKTFNPGHQLSTPILPIRNNFKNKFGNVEYQRQNFPLSLAYALTAHKCQGETLDEVIIDFGEDKENNLKNYICPGSFYVAITRVREGQKVFLKSFEKSFIKVNKKIEEKIETMIKFRSYECKKIYLDQKVFDMENSEMKIGYLNINGLLEANHCEYFNADRNLMNLDIILLSETKLNKNHTEKSIENGLDNWNVIGRYDAEDQRKHMGLLLLFSKKSGYCNQLLSLTIQTLKRADSLQIQGLIVRMMNGLKLGFIYCRSTPTEQEIRAINKSFCECNIIMGDFNLSHRINADKEKLKSLCQNDKVSILREITRSQSNNQLDYILVEAILKPISFCTSFNNFISDHKSITVRIGLDGAQISEEIKAKLTFDKESHLKTKKTFTSDSESTERSADSSDVDTQVESNDEQQSYEASSVFNRKFRNYDMATCWLNACLQLMLTAIDHEEEIFNLSSELGKELMHLKLNQENEILEPIVIKNIIVIAEDTRIAERISQLENEVQDDPISLENQIRNVHDLRYNLISGQQCVRDFFLCLQENVFSWPDVCSPFIFRLTHSTQCCSCEQIHRIETTEIFLEIDVPPANSNLSTYVSEYLNTSTLIGKKCTNEQDKFVQAEKRIRITSIKETEFIIVILTRGLKIDDVYRFIDTEVTITEDMFIRDEENCQAWYRAIAVIDYKGSMSSTGETWGHYTCDVNDVRSNSWFRTNDNKDPLEIHCKDVAKCGYVVLYKRLSV